MELNRREIMMAALASPIAGAMQMESMPQVQFGNTLISRLIVGGNPISGNSHISGRLSREMTDYFTAARIKQLLQNCESAGINTWQSRGDRHIMRLLNEYRLEGGKIKWIAQTASELADLPRNIKTIADMKPIGIYHHGTQTDIFWRAGKIEQVRELLKIIRQSGVQVGLATHLPEVVDHVEAIGWDVDFYMTCLYNLSRTPGEVEKVAGKPIQGEFFWDPDREKMLSRIRQTPRQCLIFKVYGATRHCSTPQQMLLALKLAAEYAKPTDCFVIGMYPKQTEQVRENCRLVVEVLGQRS